MAPLIPLGPSVSTTLAPSARSMLRRSIVIVSGMTKMQR
jgi:hypothetical protein